MFPSSDLDGLAGILTYTNMYICRPCKGHTHLSRHFSLIVFYKTFNTTLSLKLIKVFKSFLKYRILSVLKKKKKKRNSVSTLNLFEGRLLVKTKHISVTC